MTPLGLLVGLAAAIGIAVPRRYVVVLAAGGAAPMGAALIVAGEAVPVFYALAAGAAIGAFARLARASRRDHLEPPPLGPGAAALIGFVAWSLLVTLVGPTLFAGVPVLVPRGGLDEQVLNPGELGYTTSSVAQAGYLVLSVAVVFFVGRTRAPVASLLGVTLALVTILSFWRFVHLQAGLPFPVGFFDNSPGFTTIETTASGEPRFRGVFSEPSSLAASSLVTIAYSVAALRRARGAHLLGVLVVLAMAVVNASVSTSATFVVGAVTLAFTAVLVFLFDVVLRRARVSPFFVTLLGIASIAAIFVLPLVTDIVERTVDDKVGSSSFDSRSGADALSYRLVVDTFGIGVGLGGNRSSSFFATLLSCVGVIGTALFIAAVWSIVRRAARFPEARPTLWALIAMLITKLIAGPDLADTSGVLWLSLGVLANFAWRDAPAPLGAPLRRGAALRAR